MTTLTDLTREVTEQIDLELSLHGEPTCEDDHIWNDRDEPIPVPQCGGTAVAVMIFDCPTRTPAEPRMTLICKPLADWIAPTLCCTTHGSKKHARIVTL